MLAGSCLARSCVLRRLLCQAGSGVELLLPFGDPQERQYVAMLDVVIVGDAHTRITGADFAGNLMDGIAPMAQNALPVGKARHIEHPSRPVAGDCVNIG